MFVGPGAWGQPAYRARGRRSCSVGLEFLRRIRSRVSMPPVGRRVVVIGGGNVAVDVAVAAKRLGAETVTMACLETCDEMPAFAQEVEQAREEGVAVMDSCGPARIRVDDDGPSGRPRLHALRVRVRRRRPLRSGLRPRPT